MQLAEHDALNLAQQGFVDRLAERGYTDGEKVTLLIENGQGDTNNLSTIADKFVSEQVDLAFTIATPSTQAMASKTTTIPIVATAVTSFTEAGLVASDEQPGGNITGTSDYLDTNSTMDLIFAVNPDVKKIGFLYDVGQDASATPIAHAKEYLTARNIEYVERTATNAGEVMLAARALVGDGVDAVFTPTDNTVMSAELAIFEKLQDANIPHYGGADSFALNGAFLGYGVDYANLGRETADMIFDILYNSASPASTPVKTFDNGTATINTETCAALGMDYAELESLFSPLCTKVQPITTAEHFDDLNG